MDLLYSKLKHILLVIDLKNQTLPRINFQPKFRMINVIIIFSEPALLDECDLDERTKEVLLNNIKGKLTSQAVKIRADIECACYGYEGIDAVKTALRAGLELSTEELPIKINLIAPPLYGEF